MKAEHGFHRLLAAAPQLAACPLTQFYAWRHSCILTEWMNRTITMNYSLQFCKLPQPFLGIRKSILPGGDRVSLSRDRRTVTEAGGVCYSHSQQPEVATLFLLTFWFPRRQEVSDQFCTCATDRRPCPEHPPVFLGGALSQQVEQ